MALARQFAVAIAAAILGIGCDAPHFSRPMAEGTDEVVDTDLYGNWLSVEGGRYDKAVYVHIGRDRDTGLTTLFLTAIEDGTVETISCTAHPGVLNDRRFMSVHCALPEDRPEKPVEYDVIQYELVKDRATFRYMKEEPFVAAVEAGLLEGEIKRGEYGPDVLVTDSAQKVREFIADNKDIVWSELAVLYRIDPVKAIRGPKPKPPKKCTSIRRIQD